MQTKQYNTIPSSAYNADSCASMCKKQKARESICINAQWTINKVEISEYSGIIWEVIFLLAWLY